MTLASKLTLSLAVVVLSASPATAQVRFTALDPGGPANYRERLPVQVVFVGYTPAQVDPAQFRAPLAAVSEPVVRSRLWYGVVEPLGIHYDLDYSLTWASAQWEDAFFRKLASLAVPEVLVDGRPVTLAQELYNQQPHRKATVVNNWLIDAPSVERWLQQNPPPGVDRRRNTLYFINWFGRSDFRFHAYAKTGEPDPDTGHDFGTRQSRKLIAWGGTPDSDRETGFGASSRVWFYDLSAGPETWSNNYNITDADVDGDGVADNRMPPVWEYLADGYKTRAELAADLGLVTRFIFVNLLAATSPLYPPYLTPRRLPESINLDVNAFEMFAGLDGRAYLKPNLIRRNHRILRRAPHDLDQQDLPLTARFATCYMGWIIDQPCFADRGYPAFANLFAYSATIKNRWRDERPGGEEYEAGTFTYVTDDSTPPPYLGFADDNWVDGTQSGTFNFLSPDVIASGYGLTTTIVHEQGHHVGLSHPHDGYDPGLGTDYYAGGFFQFVNTGDEVNSMMSYIDLNWDFSQFDLDNSDRWQAAAYLKMANAIAADVLQRRRGNQEALRQLYRADRHFEAAQAAFSGHDYAAALERARQGYERVLEAAEDADLRVRGADLAWDLLPSTERSTVASKRAYSYMNLLTPHRRDTR